jgi:acetyl-CoA carboxylase biotin carboxyl carrier protein
MSDHSSEEPAAENVRAIRQLVRLMKKYDLTAIDLNEDKVQIRLRRSGPQLATVTQVMAPAQILQAAPVAAAPAPVAAAPAAPAAPTGIVIESPMVGTFYSSSSPDSPPFVTIGTQIRADMTVCVIEAMKVFTDIPAGMNGTITEVLAKNGQAVEFGQPMFRVNPA